MEEGVVSSRRTVTLWVIRGCCATCTFTRLTLPAELNLVASLKQWNYEGMTNHAEINEDDFGVIAWREDGMWRTSRLANTRDLGSIMDQVKAQTGDGGSIALIAIDEEFFLIVRGGARAMQMMLSDVTYAVEYEIAADVIDALDLPFPEDEDEPQPGGDVDLLSDFGISAMELEIMSDDIDMYPEEQITSLAHRLGFGEQFDQLYDRN